MELHLQGVVQSVVGILEQTFIGFQEFKSHLVQVVNREQQQVAVRLAHYGELTSEDVFVLDPVVELDVAREDAAHDVDQPEVASHFDVNILDISVLR